MALKNLKANALPMNNGYGHIWIYIIILKKLLYQLAAEMPNIKPVEGCVCLQLSKQIE